MNKEELRLPICDLHCDSASLWQAGFSLEDTSLQVSLPHLVEAGVGLQVFAAFVPASVPAGLRFSFVCRTIDRFKEELRAHAARIVLCRSGREVSEAMDQGKTAAVLAVENGDAIEEDLDKLERLYRMGVRLMTLAHARSNNWVISSADKTPAFEGLSTFGVEVLEAMNSLGMIIDVSHAHDRAVEKILERSDAPIVASHSCMYALCPVARNVNDRLILGIAAGGGLIGVNFHPAFLDLGYNERAQKQCKAVFARMDRRTEQAGADAEKIGRAWLAFTREYREAIGGNKVPLEKLLEHIDYLVELAGEGAAAFGSDFDGISDTPSGVEDCRGFKNILQGLQDRGYSLKRLEKICLANFMRVLRTVCG
jgi:membrane dipeptidase